MSNQRASRQPRKKTQLKSQLSITDKALQIDLEQSGQAQQQLSNSMHSLDIFGNEKLNGSLYGDLHNQPKLSISEDGSFESFKSQQSLDLSEKLINLSRKEDSEFITNAKVILFEQEKFRSFIVKVCNRFYQDEQAEEQM